MRIKNSDILLLVLAFAAAAAASLRRFGVEGISPPAGVLMAVSALLAVRPLFRLFHPDNMRNGSAKMILTVIFFVHLAGTLFFLPPEDILNDRPVLTLDHALHYYQADRAREVFEESFRLHTYDPYFMAGYPGGTVFDIDSKGLELWCAFLRFVDTSRSFKAFILMAHLLMVFTVFAGSRKLGMDQSESICAVILLMAFWHWGRPYAGDFRFAGMFSYIFICHLSLYVAGLLRSFAGGKSAWRFFIIGPLAFLVHPTAAVLLPVPFIMILLLRRDPASGRPGRPAMDLSFLLKLAGWCLLVIAANAVWLVPFFRYIDIKVPSETFFQLRGFGQLAGILFRPGNLPALGLMALAVFGCASLIRRGRRRAALAPAAGSLFPLLISGYGTGIPLFDQMEPGRFLLPAFFFMAPLAGAGLKDLFERVEKLKLGRGAFAAARPALIVVLILASPVFSLVSAREYYRHTVSTTFTPEVSAMIDELRERVKPPGRLMIEDGPGWRYGDVHLPSIVPLYTGAEQIGGLYPFAFIKHNFANFTTSRMMGKDIEKIDSKMLAEYISLYGVRWVLTATEECGGFIERSGVAERVWSSGHFRFFKVRSPQEDEKSRGYRIKAGYGVIEIAPAEEGGRLPAEITLHYHYDRGLSVDPPASISPVRVLDDPVPFILLRTGGQASVIRITYR